MKASQAHEQPVFYCKAKTATGLIMITLMDKEARVIEFQWRLLSSEEGISNRTPEPDSASATGGER